MWSLMIRYMFWVIVLVAGITGCSGQSPQVCLRDSCFDVELAITPSEQVKGLMFRYSLDTNAGMLFIYEDEQRRAFWMKNTYIPLDIIWLNRDREVVYIAKNVQPCRDASYCPIISPDVAAAYVLEINAGTCDVIGLRNGDTAQFYNINSP
jgi:uncharacterized membrane protein (UPF0127 family)